MAATAHPAGQLATSPASLDVRTKSCPRKSRNAWTTARWRCRPCSLSMNGCNAGGGAVEPVGICETRTLPAVSAPESAIPQLKLAISELRADPPRSSSGIIRLQVPIRRRAGAIDWLHAHDHLLCCYFSGRDLPADTDILSGDGSAKAGGLVAVAGVGAAVFFQGTDPFALKDWRSIKRLVIKEGKWVLKKAKAALKEEDDDEDEDAVQWRKSINERLGVIEKQQAQIITNQAKLANQLQSLDIFLREQVARFTRAPH